MAAGQLVLAVPAFGSTTPQHPRMVTVPVEAERTSILDAFDILHRLGLRVALTRRTPLASLISPVVRLSPPPGARVPRGTAIRMTPTLGAIGSPALSASDPHHRVPDFRGRPLSAGVRWAETHEMFWAVTALPPLPPSTAPHLLDAYRIVDQRPRAGATLGQGVLSAESFTVTPLTLTVVPRRGV